MAIAVKFLEKTDTCGHEREWVACKHTSKPGFLYNTSVTEIRAPIGILLFFGATNNSKVLQAFGLKMVLAS